MPALEPDKFYFCVMCASCGEPIPFLEAPSPEDEPKPRSRGIELACPHCRTQHTYRGNEVVRLQGPEKSE